jgi:hypothetical protein
MNHEDRQLIADLFDRMRSVDGLDKDLDAEAFIHQSMRENGDSPYLLVQAVLAQEVALQKADERIRELEAQVARGSADAQTSRASAGFGRGQTAASAAPWEAPRPANDRAGAFATGSAVPASGSRLASAVPATGGVKGRGPDAAARAGQAQRGGGGFMQQAMSTAAGVAGGMLLASGISSLFGGGSTATASEAGSATPAADTASADTAGADTASAENDAAMQQAGHDDWDGDGWGDDDWGGDVEI